MKIRLLQQTSVLILGSEEWKRVEVWHTSSGNFLYRGVHKSWKIASSVWSLLVKKILTRRKKTPGSRYAAVGMGVLKKSRVGVFSGYHGIWIDSLWQRLKILFFVSSCEQWWDTQWGAVSGTACFTMAAFPVRSCHGKKLICAKNKDAIQEKKLSAELSCDGRNKNYDRNERTWGAEYWHLELRYGQQ